MLLLLQGLLHIRAKNDTKNFVKFQAMGCRALLVNIPFVSADEYLDEVKQLDQLSPEMIVIQDWDAGGYVGCL